MKVTVLSKKENPLLKRTEMWVKIEANTTPKKKELRTRIASETGADEKKIIVDKIVTMAGTPECKAYIKIYEDEAVMKIVEPKHKIKEVEEDGEEGSVEEVENVQPEGGESG